MELRELEFEKIRVRCKEEGKDFIPSNWYVPARKAWEIFAWAVIQLRCGVMIHTDKQVDDFVHKYWEYIEDRAISVGEENENEN